MTNICDKQQNLSEDETNNIVLQADMYYFGKNSVSIDKIKALELYKEAADYGNCYAQLMAGYIYDYGDGVSCFPEKAIYYYSLATKQGNSNAALNLANIYLLGRNIPIDVEKGIQLLQTAAEMGNVIAASSLGRQYANGEGVEESLDLAAYWVGYAEKNGYTDCETLLSLGLLYEKYCKYSEAFVCINKALSADIYNTDAHYLYGYYKFYGIGTNKDLNDAKSHIKWVVDNCPCDEEARKLLNQISCEEQQNSMICGSGVIKIGTKTLYANDGKIYIVENQKLSLCGYIKKDGIFDAFGIRIGTNVSNDESTFVLNGIYTYVYNNYGLLREEAEKFVHDNMDSILQNGKKLNLIFEIHKTEYGYFVNEAFKRNYINIVTNIKDILIVCASFVCCQRYEQESLYYGFYSQ